MTCQNENIKRCGNFKDELTLTKIFEIFLFLFLFRGIFNDFKVQGQDYLSFPNDNFTSREPSSWNIILYHNYFRKEHFEEMKTVFLNSFKHHDLIFISFGVHQARVLQ